MMRWKSLIWAVSTIALAALVSVFVAQKITQRGQHNDGHHHHHDHDENGNGDFHEWLHKNLEITPEQEAILAPKELAFETDRRRLQAEVEVAGKALAQAIQAHDLESPEVLSAHKALLELQGDLQRATLEHFFTMKAHLSDEQGKKLLDWTHDSLIHGHRN